VLAAWSGVAALAFFASPAKMPLYLLPLAAPLALWAAAGARDESARTPWAPAWYAVWLAALVGLRGATGLIDEDRDMRALAAAVRAVAPAGTPVRLLAGKDLHGLEFYLGGDFRRVETPEVQTNRNGTDFVAEAASFDARGTTWILVTENDRAERRAVQRTLGDRAELLREFPDPAVAEFRILRIVPKAR
jgi:4-amino-4-deoxy-L-arabinose transferase